MDTQEQIQKYLSELPVKKRADMDTLHSLIKQAQPQCKVWFLGGKDETGKVIANPNIGYGQQTLKLAGGKSRPFYQIGISANASGISIYMMGLADKKYLIETYESKIGKASVTSYCVKFKTLADLNMDVLMSAVRDVFEGTS